MSLASMVPPIIIPAVLKQTATVIFLHGLGDTGHGWADEIDEIKPKYAKLICPTAGTNPVTINAGCSMPSWFDIRSLDKEDSDNEDVEGVKKASQYIQIMIEDEVKAGISPSRIVLGGFSQGAALSIYTGLQGSHLLGGIIAMSGYIPGRKTINWEAIKKPPMLQCHGDRDGVVPYKIGLGCKTYLEKHISDFTFKTYKGMEHNASIEEIEDVKAFIDKCIPPVAV